MPVPTSTCEEAVVNVPAVVVEYPETLVQSKSATLHFEIPLVPFAVQIELVPESCIN